MSFDIIENFKILPFLVFVLQRIYRTDKEPKISGIIAHALRKNTHTHLELQHTTEDCSTNKIPVASKIFFIIIIIFNICSLLMSTGARLTAVGFLHRMTRMGCRIRLLCLFHLGYYKTHLSNWIKSHHTSGSVCTVTQQRFQLVLFSFV